MFGGYVCYRSFRPALDNRVTDRVHEMGLAQAHAPIDEEWVVSATRAFGHRMSRRRRKLAVVAYHDTSEGVFDPESHYLLKVKRPFMLGICDGSVFGIGALR